MKVIATVRTLNEENNIRRFIESYDWVDDVLVADGGSDDDTVRIVNDYDYAFVRSFHGRIELNEGYWRNPHGTHLNFLFDWAKERGADWITFDDCDCVPNQFLKKGGRDVLLDCSEDIVFVTRLYVWGKDQHFPKMAQPTGYWTPSIWAWRVDADIRACEENPLVHDLSARHLSEDKILRLMPPYCLLHYYCPDEKTVEAKLKKYRDGGQHPQLQHPKDSGGGLKPLPEWAIP